MFRIIKDWFQCYFSDPEAVSLVLILLLSVVVVALLGNILVPIIVSVIIAYMLNGFVKRFERWKMPHFFAIILVYLMFVAAFLILFIWLLPLLFQQLANFISEVPNMLSKGQKFLISLQSHHPDIFSATQLQRVVAEFDQYLTNLGKFVFSYSISSIDNVITIIIYVVLVPLLVFFFLKDRKKIAGWFQHLCPQEHPAITKVWREMDRKIGDYIRGKVIELIIVSVVTIPAFAVMGLDYAALLGACVGVSVIIPYVGAILVTIPVVVVSLLQWGLSAHFVYLILVYAVITVLDANVLVPILYSETMDLHPVVIMLSILVFGSLWGFWGVFFAIPLATLIRALMKGWPKVNEEIIDEEV